MNQINKKPCEIYTNKRSCNSFTICVSVSKDTFSNVYINYQYSSDINKYSLKDISLDKYIYKAILIHIKYEQFKIKQKTNIYKDNRI